MPALHAILVTHTPQRLRRTILGIAASTRTPDTLTLTCDGDDPEIERAARDACAEAAIPLTLITRAHTGAGRAAQARNNAVRHLINRGIAPEDRLVFLDADCIPLAHTLAFHDKALASRDLVLGWRYDLTEQQDETLDEAALRAGRMPFNPTPEQDRALARRERRWKRQALLRRLGAGRIRGKQHKPKLITANFACTAAIYRAVNGHDETFQGWGQEDDDLARRIYRAGGRPRVAIRDCLVLHQFHITRAPGDWQQSPNAKRLLQPCATVAQHGVENPIEQGEVVIKKLAGKP
ncbi:MAG: galactosyltransferase-related protein [Planctomycetota bacterium]